MQWRNDHLLGAYHSAGPTEHRVMNEVMHFEHYAIHDEKKLSSSSLEGITEDYMLKLFKLLCRTSDTGCSCVEI